MPSTTLTQNGWTQIYIGGSSTVDQQFQVTGGKALLSLGTPSDATTAIDSAAFDDKLIYVPAATSVFARPNGVTGATITWGNFGSGQTAAGYELLKTGLDRRLLRGAISIGRHRLLGTGAAMSGTYTVFGCYRAPAHFDAVRIRVISTTTDTTNNVKASIMSPARRNDGVNGQDAAGSPVTPIPVTWASAGRPPVPPVGGAATAQVTGAIPAGNVEASAYSDMIAISSADRVDAPGAPPLLMLRLYGVNVPGMASAGLSVLSASTIGSVDPDHFCQFVQNADHTGTAGGVPIASTTAATQWAPAVEIIFYYRDRRVQTIAACGDSVTGMGWANAAAVNSTAGNMNGWPRRFAALCNGVAPTGFVALHRDGFTGSRYTEMAFGEITNDDMAGVTVAFHPVSSVNNWRSTPATVLGDIQRVDALIQLEQQRGIVPVLVYPWAGQDIGSVSETRVRTYIDQQAARGVLTFDARAVVSADGSTTNNIIKDAFLTRDSNGAVVDTTHLNDAGHAAIAAYAFSIRSQYGLP